MTLAEEIAREHVVWARSAGRSLREIILEVGRVPPPKRDIRFDDAVWAVAQAWIDIALDYRVAA